MSKMQNHLPVPEIFELINTAHLSSLFKNSRDPAADLRKWLISHRNQMTPECARFFNNMGVSKKGFSLTLKKWFSQYHQRQSFIIQHCGKSDVEWLSAFGSRWEELGGVFFPEHEGDKQYTDEETNRAIKVGVVTVLNNVVPDKFDFLLEALVSSKAKLNTLISLLDQCGIPIEGMQQGTNSSVTHIGIKAPTTSEFNELVKNTQLPQFANILLKLS